MSRTLITPKPAGTRLRSAPTKRTRTTATKSAIRTYRSALNFLNSKTNYEKMTRVGYNHTNFNLSRMLRILAGLDNPHKKLNFVHLAGTKGKGSTCHMLAAMLQKAGYRTGLYTSPHFVDIRERIRVNNALISEAEFTRVMGRIAPVAKRLEREGPTFFELMTAAALVHFVNHKTDLAIMETGLGGRLDSTNVIKPEACGITSISYDHMAQLGSTLERIAEEKAGIFKPGVPAVSGPQKPAVKRVLRQVAAKVGCDLRIVGEDLAFSYRFESSRLTGPHTRVCLSTPTSCFDHVRVPLLGEHQAHNCGVALGLIDLLRQRGFAIKPQQAIDGLGEVRVEGRLELIREQPLTVVDAAHNASSISALMRAIGQNINCGSMVVIFGCSMDKDIDGMLSQLRLGADKVIFTRTGTPRSADPGELHAAFQEKSPKMAQIGQTLSEAYEIARHCVSRDDLICITGSVHLVGEVKRLIKAGALR